MKIFKKISTVTAYLAVVLTFGFVGTATVFAATNPPLGTAGTYGVLSSTFTANGASSAITGDLGGTTITGTYTVTGTTTNPAPAQTDTDAGVARADIDSQVAGGCTLLGTNVVLSGTYTPGCYYSSGTMNIVLSTTVTLNGAGTYIFRAGGAITTGANSIIKLENGASSCDVFWKPNGDTTLGANTTFMGTVLPVAQDIYVGDTVNWRGRALTYGHTVTLNGNDSINSTCSVGAGSAHLIVIKHVINDNGGTLVASAFTTTISGVTTATSTAAGAESPGVDNILTSTGSYGVDEGAHVGYTKTLSVGCSGTIASGETKTCTITNDDIAPMLTVTKIVVNDNGSSKTYTDFPLFIDGSLVTSGVASTTSVGTHTISETSNSGYTATIGGDCAANGTITLALGDTKACTITNDDIAPLSYSYYPPVVPPLIDLVKMPSPLALPNGPGLVTYTYTLRNVGTVPVTNVTMVDDMCSTTTLISGDINTDSKLDMSETWVYRCQAHLAKTTINTATVTGWANGVSAVDIASATVVVGVSVVPPLIHVTKVPNPLALSAGGGAVTYTYTVTNPGTVPLSDVGIVDDKCTGLSGRVVGHPGDLNKNDLLESNESWSFTCKSNLTKTTTNVATASGSASGMTAKDFAIATVVVAAPKLPNTGLADDFGQQVRAIANSLGKGSRGSSVTVLQEFLISQNKGPAAKALVGVGSTAYFGEMTRAALAEFQANVGISPALGNFGPITRGYLKTH